MPADPINYTDLRFDEQGKPYYTTQSGRRSYLSPAAAAQSQNLRAREWAASQGERYTRDASGVVTGVQGTAAPANTFAHQNNGWNPDTGQFDIGLNQGGLGGLIEGAAGLAVPTVVGPAIANAVAGPAAGSTVAPGVVDLSTPASTAAAAPGAAPLGSLGVPAATATGAGATTAANWLDKLKNPGNLASLAGIITSLSGGGSGGGGGGDTDETKRIQAITEARMRRVDPLHQMVTQLAASRMPINVQRPVPDVPLP